MFTREQLFEMFDFDLDAGFVYHKNGERADHFSGKYRRVTIDGSKYYVHHIIWCVVHGYWPDRLDHWNGDGEDNRPDNLREATQAQNMANRVYGKMRGAEAHGRRWRARIEVNGVRIELGSYASREEAIAAYEAGAERYFGQYAEHNRPN